MKNGKSLFRVLGVFVVFILVFIVLVNKQKSETFGDVASKSFSVSTIQGKQLVARDTSSIYPRYFVVYFSYLDRSYIVHSFNYYDTESQYELDFNRYLSKVVDYDYNKYMLRYIYKEGYGSYDEVKEELPDIINSNNFVIYE